MLPPARPSSSSISVEERSVAIREDSDELSDKTINGYETAELPLWPPKRRRRHHHHRRHSPTNRHQRRQQQRRRRRTASCSSRFGQRGAAPATASQIALNTAKSEFDVSPAEQQQQQQKTDEGRERIWNGLRRPKAPREERETPKMVLIVRTQRSCSSPLPASADNTNNSRRLWLKKAAAVAALLLLCSSIGCCSAGQRLLFGKSDWRLLLAALRCDVVDALCHLHAAVCQRRCPPGRLSFLADNNNYY